MSDILDRNINLSVSDVPLSDLKIVMAGFIDEANKIMGRGTDDKEVSWLIEWAIRYTTERYNYMPLHHIRAAIAFGAMGERGGTSKLMPRNIAIWIREQANIYQEQIARRAKTEDEKVRNDNFNANKAEWQVAAAVRIKVGWLGDKVITSKQYDSFSSKVIYDLLKSGVSERDIRLRNVVPNYEEYESNT